MSNPILNRVESDAQRGYAGFRDYHEPAGPGPQQAYGQQSQQGYAPQPPAPGGYTSQPTQGYGQPGYGQPQPGFGDPGTGFGYGGDGGGGGRSITLDDVLIRTGALFAVMLAVAAIGWSVASVNPALGGLMLMVGIAATLGLGIYFFFRRKPISAPLAIAYAAFEGVLVGPISSIYHQNFDPPGIGIFESIVTQAILATICVFVAMLTLYKTGIIKVNQKFRAIMGMALVGYFLFSMVNLAFMLFFDAPPFGIGGVGPIGIAISAFAVGLASLTLAIDFDNINIAITTGAPVNYGWTLAIGLLVTLVWLYLELLRLLARLRSD